MLKESSDAGAEFVLKEGVAIPALPIALKTMKKGEKATLILKPGCELPALEHSHVAFAVVALCAISLDLMQAVSHAACLHLYTASFCHILCEL